MLAAFRKVSEGPFVARAIAHFAFAVAGEGWGFGFGRDLGSFQGDLDARHN